MGAGFVAYAARRLVAGIPVVAMVAFVTFALVYMTPGDAAVVIAGEEASPEAVQAVRQALGLDKPLLLQFTTWVSQVLTGNLGHSLILPQTVAETLLARSEPTIVLALMAQIIAVLLAVPLGVLAANYNGRAFDRFVNVFAVVGIAVPSFVIGIGLILIFSIVLGVLPTGGYSPLERGLNGTLRTLILPATALGFAQAAFIVRITRMSMEAVLVSDFVRAATMRGFSRSRILARHVIRAGIGPTISAIGISFASLVGGSIVVEVVFNLPGLGRLLMTSIQNRDIPMLQGLLLVTTIGHVIINIVTDILQAAADPRVSL